MRTVKKLGIFSAFVFSMAIFFGAVTLVSGLATDPNWFANYVNRSGKENIYTSGNGLGDNNYLLLDQYATKNQNGVTFYSFESAFVLYAPNKLSASEKNQPKNQCSIKMTIVVAGNNLGSGTAYVSRGAPSASSDTVYAGVCSDSILNEARAKFDQKSVAIGKSAEFAQRIGQNSGEVAGSNSVTAIIVPVIDAGPSEEIDESRVPKNDTITLKKSTGEVVTQQSNDVTITPPPSSSVHYTIKIDNVAPGEYEICSKIVNKCERFTKEPNKVPPQIRIQGDESTKMSVAASEGAGETDEGCESNGGDLGWLFCPLVRLLDAGITEIDEQVNRLLEVPPKDYSKVQEKDPSKENQLYTAWKSMRNLAYIILIPVVLVMVIGTALGFDIISAYTVRKALPRLIAATLFIALSWEITTFLITFTNNVGSGILGLLTNAFGDNVIPTKFSEILNPGDAGVTFSLTALAAGAYVTVLGTASIGILLSYAVVAFLAIFVGFVVLALRQVILLALTLIAPVAILAWIFPGNDKIWKLWWSSFSKLLLMFPLIAGLIAAGRIFAGVASITEGGIIGLLIKITAYIAPYFFIPATFKFAGGIFATISGMANDKSRGLFDRQKKYRQETAGRELRDFTSGAVQGRLRGAASRAVGQRIGVGMKGRFGLGSQAKFAEARDQLERKSALENIMKGSEFGTIRDDDPALRAATYLTAAEAKANMGRDFGMSEQDVDRAIRAVQTSIGFGRPQQIAAAQQLVSTGTGYDNISQMSKTLARASGGNASTANGLAGFANFEAKNKGRFDLSPSFGELSQLVQAEAGIGGSATIEDYHRATVKAARGADAVSVLRGKPGQVKYLTQSLGDHLQANWRRYNDTSLAQPQRDAALNEVLQTAAQINQLDSAKGYASQENQASVNSLLNDVQPIRSALEPLVHPGAQPTPTTPAIPKGIHADRWKQLAARPPDPRDPNLP
jgi:MFS family permease